MQNNVARDGAIDAAKAISIVLVLIWHLQPFSVASGLSGRIVSLARFSLDLLYIQISLIAVPLFILISLGLLWRKLDTIGLTYAYQRVRRLAYLYAVWTVLQFACLILLYGYHRFRSHAGFSWPQFGESVPVLIMNGGPSLPTVGGSVFYFLFVLLCLSVLLTLFHAIPLRPKRRYVFACITFVLCLCYFQVLNWNGGSLAYWRLDNFLVYVPLAYIVTQRERPPHAGTVALLLACFAFFAIQDVYIRRHIGSTGAYSRASVVFGSVALLALCRVALPEKNKLSGVAAFFATYALGLFAIHKYWQLVINLVSRHFDCAPYAVFLDMRAFVEAIACITLTCATAYLIGRTRWRALVR